jgi:hypothetical protein
LYGRSPADRTADRSLSEYLTAAYGKLPAAAGNAPSTPRIETAQYRENARPAAAF